MSGGKRNGDKPLLCNYLSFTLGNRDDVCVEGEAGRSRGCGTETFVIVQIPAQDGCFSRPDYLAGEDGEFGAVNRERNANAAGQRPPGSC